MNDDLRLALQLADAADEITLHHFQSSTLSVRTKSDRTPVSEADEAVERAIRATLDRERPGDGIVGEEFGSAGSASRRWIIDPIDATKNYIRGIPIFATLIALEGIAGVVSAPALGRRWWAARGEGAFCNGKAIRVSSRNSLDQSQLCYDDIAGFEAAGSGEQFLKLARRCGRTRGFGDFWSHMMVAEGSAEIAVEPQVALWDMAPIQIIVEEAGGRFTSLRGEARPDGGSGLSTNGIVHELVLEALR